MNDIVIIGANDFQLPLILKAKEKGYTTHVFAWEEGATAKPYADFFYPISIVEKDEILEICKEIKPCAVATIASDLANITVQYLAQKLELTHNSSECIEVSTNKYKMRCALQKSGIGCPRFVTVDQNTDVSEIDMGFPLIVKPTDRSGSRGIAKVNSVKELSQAISIAAGYSFENKAIVEEYIDGDEYSCECISFAGEHHMLAITKKYTTGAPDFIETGHIEPSMLDSEQQKWVKNEVFSALDALQVRYGASHSEFRIDENGKISVIEIGSRMGGDCIGSHLVELSTGHDFVGMVVDVAAGKQPKISCDNVPTAAGIRFVFGKKDMEILENINKHYKDNLYFVSDISEIGGHEVVDSGSRYGFYIATAATAEQLISILEL